MSPIIRPHNSGEKAMHPSIRNLACAVVFVGLMHLSSVPKAQDGAVRAEQEHNDGPGHTQGATENEIAAALAMESNFREPGGLSFNDDQLSSWASSARKAKASLHAEPGGQGKYDVVIQVGHYPRTTGATGGQGKRVNEQEASAWVAEMLSSKLRAAKLNAIVIPADNFRDGLRTRAFIALHTDASNVACKVGPSLGYGNSTNKAGMNTLAVAVAISLGIPPEKFMRDNYTKNLSGYYAYKRIDASDYEGVLEMIELTCPEQEDMFLGNASTLADNLATAIQISLR